MDGDTGVHSGGITTGNGARGEGGGGYTQITPPLLVGLALPTPQATLARVEGRRPHRRHRHWYRRTGGGGGGMAAGISTPVRIAYCIWVWGGCGALCLGRNLLYPMNEFDDHRTCCINGDYMESRDSVQ